MSQRWRTFGQTCEYLLVEMAEGFVVPTNKSRMLIHTDDLMDMHRLLCRCASHSWCRAGPAANGFGEGVEWKSQMEQVEKC